MSDISKRQTGLRGFALLIRVFLNIYLLYSALTLKLKIPGWFFILYGLCCLSYTIRILTLNKMNKSFPELHGYTSVYEMPVFMEAIAGALINIGAGIYLIMIQKK